MVLFSGDGAGVVDPIMRATSRERERERSGFREEEEKKCVEGK